MIPKVGYVTDCKVKEQGVMQETVRFILGNQIKDRTLWHKFNEVFTTREDTEEGRWRGEYFGKQSR